MTTRWKKYQIRYSYAKEIDFDDVGHEDWWIQENGLIEWFSKTPNCYIKDAYLAGKALGVDLVKVVEG